MSNQIFIKRLTLCLFLKQYFPNNSKLHPCYPPFNEKGKRNRNVDESYTLQGPALGSHLRLPAEVSSLWSTSSPEQFQSERKKKLYKNRHNQLFSGVRTYDMTVTLNMFRNILLT